MPFHSWSSGAVILTFTTLFAAAMALAPLLGNRLLSSANAAARHDAASDTLKMIGALTAVFLSFALLQSMREFRQAETAVGHEAGDLLQLDRALAIARGADARPARTLLRRYAHLVIDVEWPALHQGRQSPPETARAFADMAEAVETLIGHLIDVHESVSQIAHNLDELHDDRTARIGYAEAKLPPEIWSITVVLFTLVLMASAGMRPASHWMGVNAMYGAALAVLAACFYLIDAAFQGDLSVSVRPFAEAIAAMDARLR